jgi:regulator of sigma E protease
MSIVTHFWSYGVYIIPFIFVLSTVVFFHELGHFLIGRWCGVKVDAFSLGFGPELAHFNDRYGTRWRIAALPLGGYVKFHGDANGASMTDDAEIASMSPDEKALTFHAQPVWKRAAIVAAGPGASFLLAILLFTGIFYVDGKDVLAPRVNGVAAGSAAEGAGFKAGDMVVSIDGNKIDSFEDMQRIIQASGDEALNFVVDRDGQTLNLIATPRRRDVKTAFGTTRVGVLGVEASNNPANWHVEHYGLLGSAKTAVAETWYVISRTGSYLGGLIVGRESADQLSGIATIAQASGEMAKVGFSALLSLTAVLSISIGFLNLMPIPLLDGGHLFYYAVEAIRGRALNEKTQQFGFRIGLTLVAGLMIFATYNDIARLTRQWMHWG